MNGMLRSLFLASAFAGVTHLGVAETLNPLDTSVTPTTAEVAQKGDTLVSFVGVNANLNATDAKWQPVLAALRTLGVQHVRDSAVTGAPQAFFDRHAEIGSLGIRSIYTAPHGTSAAALDQFAGRVSADIEGLEVPSGPDAASDAASVQDLRSDVTAVHSSAKTLGLLSFGPTLASASSYPSLGDLTALVDYAGLGSLPCAGVEEQNSTLCSVASKQVQASLTGQPYFVSGTTFAAASASQLPPAVAAVYLPRVLLEEWNAGAKRSYRADLEVGSANDFALLDQAGAETPAFRALAALLSLLKDDGTAFQPGSLQYSLSGVDSSVHHALFQKHDGSFYLALWIDAPSYDPATRKALTVPGQVAKLATADAMSMTLYQFDETGKVTSSSATLSTPQTIPVSDRLVVIKLAPQTSSSGTAAASTTTALTAVGTAATANTAATAADNSSSSNGGSTFYISSSSGDDANDGLSSSKPWKTIAKLNSSTSLYKPGASILLKRGDVFRDDYIRILNQVNTNNSTTLANTPLPVTGTASQPIVIGAYGSGANPLIDAADPLHVTWTRVTPTTWQATLASLPSKLFVDSLTAETAQLVPQPNAVGAWRANTAYHFLDLVTYQGRKYVVYGPQGTIGTPSLPYGQPYVTVTNTAAGNSSQTFSDKTSGLRNVENTPGSWYGSGTTVYVHLADGSNPNNHVIEGTYRPYGVLLMSVNHVTVENLTIERPQMLGIAMGTWADSSLAGHYITNEYNSVLNTEVWNWGNLGGACMPARHSCSQSGMAGILSEAYGNGSTGGAPLRGTVISGNYVGRSDDYFGLRSMVLVAGIDAFGQNAAVISNNRIVTINNECLNYQPLNGAPANVGGDISYNYCGNNQGNYFFGGTTGGRIHHNIAANSFGEGIQLGGNDYGGMVDHNLLYNLGPTASTVGYNGIDCNGTGRYMTLANNTIVNVFAATITLEGGCDHAYIVNNVLSIPKTNHGLFYDWVIALSPSAVFQNNLYSNTANVHPWQKWYRLADWKVVAGERDAQQSDPVFINPAIGDYRLANNSIGIDSALSVSGVGSGDLGAELSAAGNQ